MDYKQAKNIREKSFGTLLAEQEGGFGSSLQAAISLRTQARMAGLKEKFDPLNIAKALTGGSNWAPAMLGKLFGIDKKRVNYFSGVKNKTSPLSNVDSIDSPEVIECLGYIYKSLKQSIVDKRLAEEEKKNRLEEEDAEEEIRNQEIVKALTARFGTKQKPYRDEKGRFAKKPKEIPIKPTTTTKVTPTSAAGKATGTSIGGTAAVVGGAAIVAGAGATLGISKAIAQGESAGASYNAANKGTKNNKIVAVSKPVNLEDMTIAEVMRRQAIKWGDANESEKLFAVGKYQMIPDTLAGAVKSMSIDTNQKFTGALQEKMFEQYLIGAKQPAVANYLNSPVDDPTLLYKALKGLSNEWASIADPDIAGGKTSHYGSGNKASVSVETMTALLKQDRLSIQKNRAKEVPTNPTTGDTVNKGSSDLSNARADINASNDKSPPVVSSTNVNAQAQNTPTSSPQGNDKPAYVNKVKM